MKTMIINSSPRKGMNTAQLLKQAQAGAVSVGAETEYIDLYDLSFTGCRSCLACKRKDVERCRCYWKDDLSPVLDRIFQSDSLIIGVPIFLGDTTSQFHALMERLTFVALSYDSYTSYFQGSVDVGVLFTMNAPRDFYEAKYEKFLSDQLEHLRFLNGRLETYACCDTQQVKDYSRYAMARFSEEHKRQVHDTQFPKDMEAAFALGARLSAKGA